MRIHFRVACLIAIGLIASLVLAACSGSKASGPKLRADVTYEEIAAVLFDAGDLPPELAHLQASPENPIRQTEESVVEDSFNVKEDSRDLKTFGWEAEWYTEFGAPLDSGGVVYVLSDAALYKTAGGAQGDLQDQLVEAVDFAGRTNANGTTFVEAHPFDVDGLGEEAIGFEYKLSTGTEPGKSEFYGSLVAFRVDRLIGVVVLGSVEQEDMRPMALNLAAVLAEKFDFLIEA